MAAFTASVTVVWLGTTASAAARYSGLRSVYMARRASVLEESGLPPPTVSASSGRSKKRMTPFWCSSRMFSGRLMTPPPQESSCRPS